MRLIDNWREAWKFWSVRMAVFASLGNLAIMALPLDSTYTAILNSLFSIGIAVARVLKQPDLP